jgi:hypothetical protein
VAVRAFEVLFQLEFYIFNMTILVFVFQTSVIGFCCFNFFALSMPPANQSCPHPHTHTHFLTPLVTTCHLSDNSAPNWVI